MAAAIAEPQAGRTVTRARLSDIVFELRRLPWAPIILLGGFLFIAAFPGLLTSSDPYETVLSNRLQPPAWAGGDRQYFLGTDNVGRDVLARVLYGARTSLVVAAAALLCGGGLGLIVGTVAGYLGGKVESVLMRVTDCFMAVPTLLIALVFVVSLGPGLQSVVIAMSIILWARFARIIRSEVLSLKRREFVLLARVAGCSSLRLILVHILPNVLNTFIVIATLQVSRCILTEASLSFLGAGIAPPTPTWGNMVADGRRFIYSAWWVGLFPGLALTLVVFSFNSLGDWLRDRLDPRLRQS